MKPSNDDDCMLMARNDINDADDEDDRVRRGCIEEEGIFLSVMEDKNDEGCCLRTTELDVVVSRRGVLFVMEDKKGIVVIVVVVVAAVVVVVAAAAVVVVVLAFPS